MNIDQVCAKVETLIRSYMSLGVSSHFAMTRQAIESTWIALPARMYKVNVDAAWSKEMQKVGVDWVIRDISGQILGVNSKTLNTVGSCSSREGKQLSQA